MRAEEQAAAPELLAPHAERLDGPAAQEAVAQGERRPLAEEALASLPLAGDLMEELLRAREQGLVGDRELADLLVRLYLQNGEPARAYALLAQHGSDDFSLWWGVAEAFSQQGDAAHQREVLLAALERWPQHPALLDQLQSIDPGLVVASLRAELALQQPPGEPTLRARLARALVASGARDEARALIEALLADQPDDFDTITLLAELDPEAALARLDSAFGDSEEQGSIRYAMLDILIGSGNPAAAEDVLTRYQRGGQPIDPSEWGLVADAWLSHGDTRRGTSALFQALGCEQGDPDSWVHSLEDLAPEALLTELERRIASDARNNDEYWGSLADSYWRAGRTADARAAWERAYDLDRGDGEWPMRLEALRAGRDPYDG